MNFCSLRLFDECGVLKCTSSPQTVVLTQKKFGPYSPQIVVPNRFSLRSNDWTISCVSHCIPIEHRFHSLSWAGLQVDPTRFAGFFLREQQVA